MPVFFSWSTKSVAILAETDHQRLEKRSIMMYKTLHGMPPEYLRSNVPFSATTWTRFVSEQISSFFLKRALITCRKLFIQWSPVVEQLTVTHSLLTVYSQLFSFPLSQLFTRSGDLHKYHTRKTYNFRPHICRTDIKQFRILCLLKSEVPSLFCLCLLKQWAAVNIQVSEMIAPPQ